jgi:hypothetical protein
MTAKEDLIDLVQLTLQRLPDDATLRELIEELEVLEDLEEVEREVDEGKVMTLEEFKKRTDPCLSK